MQTELTVITLQYIQYHIITLYIWNQCYVVNFKDFEKNPQEQNGVGKYPENGLMTWSIILAGHQID